MAVSGGTVKAGGGEAIPRRRFGQTGLDVSLFGLGGEGVLRTQGRETEAVRVIQRALDLGVNYFDTAPAYESSLDYYGAALGERRNQIFLASKTQERGRDASLRLLDDSLRRLRTDRLDLWQLHDLRTVAEVNRIFAKGGAMEALIQARADGRVRFLGITGHHDPAILLEAMRRFDFDSALVALNAADVHHLSFIRTMLPEAVRAGMAVIGMKTCAGGKLLGRGRLTPDEALGYVLSLPGVSHVIVGCRTPAEVEENIRIVRQFVPFDEARLRALEERTRRHAPTYAYYKKPT
jgi:aryl-alcohol dehydrogenase-like predicted oxidoreductase